MFISIDENKVFNTDHIVSIEKSAIEDNTYIIIMSNNTRVKVNGWIIHKIQNGLGKHFFKNLSLCQ